MAESISLKIIIACILVLTFSCGTRNTQDSDSKQIVDNIGIKVDSSRYWKYDGKKTLLLGAFNHGHNPFIDGSTLDGDGVDSIETIVNQMHKLANAGGNTLRCVLDPGNGAIYGIESYKKDENGLYDLTKPEGKYWERFTQFIAEAKKLDVIVEIEIWDRFDWYGENWKNCPFNPVNNINYTMESSAMDSAYDRGQIYLNHPMSKTVPGHPAYDTATVQRKKQFDIVRKYQEVYVEKVFECASSYPNVLFNMNNETSEPAPWSEYWIQFLRKKAKKKSLNIICTNMADGVFKVPESEEFNKQLNRPDIYDYLDASQVNSRHRDEVHWRKIKWITDRARENGILIHMTKLYGNDERKPSPWASWKPGDSDNAIEEWWRNLIAGVAGVRFHRPEHGLGLSAKAIACIVATRKIESKVKLWEVEPHMELLSKRDFDEAYLGANPGQQYILYFTHLGAGSVDLNLEKYKDTRFTISWVNIDSGNWGPETEINGGAIQTISRPDDSAHWVAALYKNQYN